MVLGLGCTITGKKPQDMTIEGYLRQVSCRTVMPPKLEFLVLHRALKFM